MEPTKVAWMVVWWAAPMAALRVGRKVPKKVEQKAVRWVAYLALRSADN